MDPSSGAVVGQVNATDRDEAGTDHTKIRYTLLDGKDLFSIDSQTGVIKTTTATLDREVTETLSLSKALQEKKIQNN